MIHLSEGLKTQTPPPHPLKKPIQNSNHHPPTHPLPPPPLSLSLSLSLSLTHTHTHTHIVKHHIITERKYCVHTLFNLAEKRENISLSKIDWSQMIHTTIKRIRHLCFPCIVKSFVLCLTKKFIIRLICFM